MNILRFLLITRQDKNFKWIKVDKVNWWNPLTILLFGIGTIIYKIKKQDNGK